MRRIAAIMLSVILLSCFEAAGAEDSSAARYYLVTDSGEKEVQMKFIAGVTFGMQAKDVVTALDQAGYTLANSRGEAYESLDVALKRAGVHGFGKIAGIENSAAGFAYKSKDGGKGLYSVTYWLDKSDHSATSSKNTFEALEDKLTELYGKPEFSSSTGTIWAYSTELPSQYASKSDYTCLSYFFDSFDKPYMYTQRLIIRSDGSAVLIEHLVMINGKNMPNIIHYILYDVETAGIRTINDVNGDL